MKGIPFHNEKLIDTLNKKDLWMTFKVLYMSQPMRKDDFAHRGSAKTQVSLCIHVVSPELLPVTCTIIEPRHEKTCFSHM